MTIKEADTIILQAVQGRNLKSYERVAGFCYLFEKNFNKVAEMLGYAYNTVKVYWYKVSQDFLNRIEKVLNSRKNKTSYAYIMINDNNYLKVGYSQEPNKRVLELSKNSTFGKNYQILYTWAFDNIEDGYEMEIWLHRYYKKKGFILSGQDHFYNAILTKKDIDILNLKAEEIKINSKKWLDNLNII